MSIAILTHSRLKVARECARLHQFKYVLGYRPNEEAAELAFGTLIHLGLEAWWNAVKSKTPVDEWLGLAVLAVRAAQPDPFDLARAEVLLAGYHTRWADDAALYEVLGVEERFEFPLINPLTGGRSTVWHIAGKLDVRVRRLSDSTIGFIEHKTSSEDVSPGSTYFARLRMDGQVSIYFDGAASRGEPPKWCLYDVIGKPSQRPLKATPMESRKYKQGTTILYANQRAEDETPSEYQLRIAEVVSEDSERFFVRGEVVRLEAELNEARAEVWQQAAMLRENANADRHPRNPDSCTRGQRICPFFAVCCGEATLQDAHRFTRIENLHPELAGNPTSEAAPKEVAHA